MGPEQADIFISEGVDPGKVMIGHMCGNADLKYHASVLEKGFFIGFDKIGHAFFMPDKMRKATLIGLLGIGYADRIMLSHDCVPHFKGRPASTHGYAPSYTRIFKEFIPALKEAGINNDQINAMMKENPRKLFY
jgi:phosphotriesterase-related protein